MIYTHPIWMRWLLAALGLLLIPAAARAQLIIDPRPEIPIMRPFQMREVTIDADIRDQVAQVQVSQTCHNPGRVTLEAQYLFPVPESGAIQDFVLLADGKEIPGRLLAADEARKIYEDIVRRRRDPALLEYMGRGLIRTSVFPIPPGADRQLTLRYTQLLNADNGLVDFIYPLGTQKMTREPIGRLGISVRIQSREPIKSVYSPTHDVTF